MPGPMQSPPLVQAIIDALMKAKMTPGGQPFGPTSPGFNPIMPHVNGALPTTHQMPQPSLMPQRVIGVRG